MAKTRLTDILVKSATPKDKDYWLTDGGGLRLLIKSNGTKCWRFNYRFAGKQKTLALGIYPDISLKRAREDHSKAKLLISSGEDPALKKQQKKQIAKFEHSTMFRNIAYEWWVHQKGTWNDFHAQRVWNRLSDNTFNKLGNRPIGEIKPADVIAVVRSIEKRDALDIAARVLADIRRVCRYAVQTGQLDHNPASELADVLKSRKTEHRASLPRNELPAFLKDLEEYDQTGRLLTKLALQLLVMTFVRPGELRGARWEEFDLVEGLWRIPGERMKMGTDHIVPLASQAISVITQIKPITGQYEMLFPSEKNRFQVMSDGTLRMAMFRMGYDGSVKGKSRATPHGFRATASSILNETGFNPDAIERQLSHMERNGVRAAYTHHARYLDERKKMMQWWADYLDSGCKETAGSLILHGNFGN